ncbi:hypothetical protein KUTeg_014230 [Tegillarca granosa]|uniref:carbonic anhydrase n=1 Tax=Tegillarca granosa TaxID=220873 RepID=A0ABQ9EZI3_TEGGR|nr:hypothetical protein KUTeg_014230 [Tegillarca granosa]
MPTICEMVYDRKLRPFRLHGFQRPLTYSRVKNNGHTVQVEINDNLTVQGGGLDGPYKVSQFHFHWGPDSNRGSEHCYNGMYFPLEEKRIFESIVFSIVTKIRCAWNQLHIVTFNMKYPSIQEAMKRPDGLAVLGFWFEVFSLSKAAIVLPSNIIHRVVPQSNLISVICFYIQRFRTLYEDKTGTHPMV